MNWDLKCKGTATAGDNNDKDDDDDVCLTFSVRLNPYTEKEYFNMIQVWTLLCTQLTH